MKSTSIENCHLSFLLSHFQRKRVSQHVLEYHKCILHYPGNDMSIPTEHGTVKAIVGKLYTSLF